MRTKKNNTITASGLMTALREIRSTLHSVLALAKVPKTTPMLVTIHEDEKGEHVAMRFSDEHYQYDETLNKRTIFEWEYTVRSAGISITRFTEYEAGTGVHSWNRVSIRHWSSHHEEHSDMRLAELPRGKYPAHVKLIREHFSKLPAWAWAVCEL